MSRFHLVLAALLLGGCASKAPAPAAPAPTPAPPPAVKTATVAAAAPKPATVWADRATFGASCKASLDRARTLRDNLKSAPPASEARLTRYNQLLSELDSTMNLAGLISNTHTDKAVREAAEACERDVRATFSEINLDRGLYEVMSGADTKALDADAKRFAFKVLREFKRAGVDKDEATREKLRKLDAEMVQTGQDFARNIRAGTATVAFDPAELEGMPADFLAAHKPNADGKIILSTDYPDYFPIQNYATQEATRKKLSVAFLNRGYPKNEPVLKKLLELRWEYAHLLGQPSWAEHMASDKMIGSAKAIENFIASINGFAKPRMTKELKELLARKKKDDPKAKAIEQWDRFYYVDRVRQEKYGFDAQIARPYFPYDQTLAGMFALYGELFGVEFRRVERPVWHPKVQAYEMLEKGVVIGRFYLDMHPRADKYNHAAMFPMVTGLSGGVLPEASLVCNFPEGAGLMEHSDVSTLFHEFGHLIHHLLARSSTWVNLSGINTEWDFVEAPSQLLEEWTWDAKVLGRFAMHNETHAAIPAELVQKLRTSAEFGKGTHVMRQVFYTSMSYYLHAKDPKGLNLDKATADIAKKYSPYPEVPGTHLWAGFGHIEGYSSMYYTYQWSLVLAKDIFTRFEKAGLLDPGAAADYREKILKQGGRKDAKLLMRDFLGRESTLEAYKRWLERN